MLEEDILELVIEKVKQGKVLQLSDLGKEDLRKLSKLSKIKGCSKQKVIDDMFIKINNMIKGINADFEENDIANGTTYYSLRQKETDDEHDRRILINRIKRRASAEDYAEFKYAVEKCRCNNMLCDLKNIYPKTFNKVMAVVYDTEFSWDRLVNLLVDENIKVNLYSAKPFYTKEQALIYLNEYYLDGKNTINRIRENKQVVKSLKEVVGKGNYYKFFKEVGLNYDVSAYQIDVLDELRRKIKKVQELGVFATNEKDKLFIEMYLKKVALPNPKNKNEMLTAEQVASELGGCVNGKTPKVIYTDELILNLYKDFIATKKKENCKEPYKHIYEDVAVLYGVTKLAKIRDIEPTNLAKMLDKYIDKMYVTDVYKGTKEPRIPLDLKIFNNKMRKEEQKNKDR